MSNYRIDQAGLARCFAALSNPHRLAIFERLCSCCKPGTSCDFEQAAKIGVGELRTGLSIAPSTLSHHLKTLRDAGLVVMERRGKRVECHVEPEVLAQLARFFSQPLGVPND